MRIVVTTPTGNVGSRVVHLLVQAGVSPVVPARDPVRLDPALRDRGFVAEQARDAVTTTLAAWAHAHLRPLL